MSAYRPYVLSFLFALASFSYIGCASAQHAGMSEAKAPERERISTISQIHTAYHEAAHAVIYAALLPGRGAESLEVFSRVSEHHLGLAHWDTEPPGTDAAWYRALSISYYAGSAAEEKLYNTPQPLTSEDYENASFAILNYCALASCTCPPESRVGDRCLLDGWVAAQRPILYAAAQRCIEANLAPIMDLAKLLLLQPETRPAFERSLPKQELTTFFAAHPLTRCPD